MDSQNYLKTDEVTGIEVLYRGGTLCDLEFNSELVQSYNSQCDFLDLDPITDNQIYSKDFLIPDEYKQLDVLEYIVSRVPDHEGRRQRVAEELALFQARNLFPLLQMLIYIVDQMRNHGIICGVGRGSSVASYCLYLIGVHKIDSYQHDLPIQEFLK